MPGDRESAAVVVAHPDDEALWLSSVVGSAGRIVFCFGAPFGRPEKARARRRAIAALPLPHIVDLAIPESGARTDFDWARPTPTPAGIALLDAAAAQRYEANFASLVEGLRAPLAGITQVFTHNPWGEYGHAEHIQVHRAVVLLQRELGFTIGFSNYVGEASWPLARQIAPKPCWSERRVSPTDRSLARRLRRVYRRHGAWTWSIAHRWPTRETLYSQPPPDRGGPRYPFSGETLLEVSRLRWWSPPWRAARRPLP